MELPVNAKTYFDDFSFDLINFDIFRDSTLITTAKGLMNCEDRKNFISFPINTNIKTGDIVKAASETYLVKEICIDTYEGVPELIQAYF